jgi:hypothetical protein
MQDISLANVKKLFHKFTYDKFLKALIFLTCFFSFSYNNLSFGKYSFPLGTINFYFSFVAMSLFFTNKIVKNKFRLITKSDFIFLIIFSSISFISFFIFYLKTGFYSKHFISQLMLNLYIYFFVILIRDLVLEDDTYKDLIYKSLIFSIVFLLLSSFVDLLAIKSGYMQNSFFENSFFRGVGHPYETLRLRGFTQEPSYFSLVLATLYPFLILEVLKRKASVIWLFLLSLFYIVSLFTLSKLIFISLIFLNLLILFFEKVKIKFSSLLFIFITVFTLAGFFNFNNLLDSNKYYIKEIFPRTSLVPNSFLDSSHTLENFIEFDSSTITRLEHMSSCFKIAFVNFPFGVGLGQAGFFIKDSLSNGFISDINKGLYTPLWINLSSTGGTPSFSWPFKLVAEIGFLGISFLIYFFWLFIQSLKFNLRYDINLRFFVYSFFGFLLASFAVEGNFYLTGWLIFGAILGIIKKNNAKQSLS